MSATSLCQTASAFLIVLIMSVLSSAQTAPPVVQANFDFRNGSPGWQAGFADYPPYTDNGFYELRAEMRNLPPELSVNGTGFYIQGSNHSDDLFMFLKRRLGPEDGIVAGQTYQLEFTIVFASNAQSSCGGVGGTPGESVYLKAGASSIEPLAVLNSRGDLVMNVDKGNQAQGGTAASVVSSIANGLPCNPSSTPYVSVQRNHRHTSLVTANANGELWLLIGTDSGYEALTALYYQSLGVKLTPTNILSSDPYLLVENNTETAIALDSVTQMSSPFSLTAKHNFSADQRTRISLFAINAALRKGEDISALMAQAEDAQHRVYRMPVEFVGQVPNFDWLTQIVIRVPDDLQDGGDVHVSINLHGVTSNQARISFFK